jgi:hypothetical protein
MPQHVGMRLQSDAGGQAGEGPAGMVGVDRGAPLGAEHQVQLDLPGWPAGFDPSKRYRLGLPAGEAQAGLLAAVMAERLDGERWQGEDGVAGSGLDWPDREFLASAVGVGVGEDGRVDDGERLAEPDRAGVQIQIGPFQAAQLAVRAPVAAASTVQEPSQGLVVRSAASNSTATCSGVSVTTSVGGTGGGMASVATLRASSRQVTAWARARCRQRCTARMCWGASPPGLPSRRPPTANRS